jgi:plasmid stability protein
VATLYVRSFPDDLYEELRAFAAQDGRSLSGEVVALLEASLQERRRRQDARAALERIGQRRRSRRPSPVSVLDLVREDRER